MTRTRVTSDSSFSRQLRRQWEATDRRAATTERVLGSFWIERTPDHVAPVLSIRDFGSARPAR